MSNLKKEFAKKIYADPELQGILAKRLNKSVVTIIRWAKINNEKLTMLPAIDAIREYYKLPKNESLLQEELAETK